MSTVNSTVIHKYSNSCAARCRRQSQHLVLINCTSKRSCQEFWQKTALQRSIPKIAHSPLGIWVATEYMVRWAHLSPHPIQHLNRFRHFWRAVRVLGPIFNFTSLWSAWQRVTACICCWAPAMQQLINISCLLGPQQQICCTLMQWSIDGTDRQTDTFHRPCSAYYANSTDKLHIITNGQHHHHHHRQNGCRPQRPLYHRHNFNMWRYQYV